MSLQKISNGQFCVIVDTVGCGYIVYTGKKSKRFFAQISPCNTKQTFQGGFSHIQLKYFEYIVSKVACLHKQTLLASTAENTTSQPNSNSTIPF